MTEYRGQRSNRLVRALGGQDVDPPENVELRTGVVQAINKSVEPWELTVTLGNVNVPEVHALGWWDFEVGSVVEVLKAGPRILVLGPLAPGKVYMPPAPPPPPPPPTPPPAPPAATRTVPITADGSASWQFSFSTWRNDFIQGGSGAGKRRAFWFYGSKIPNAKGAGTIIGASIFVRRTSQGGVYGGANVRLGVHQFGGASGNGGVGHAAVAVVGQLNKEQGATFALTAAQIQLLNTGTYFGLGLEPGSESYSSPDYLVGYGRDAGAWSGQLSLTIQG